MLTEVWGISSRLIQVTVAPTGTGIVCGPKLKLSIVTSAAAAETWSFAVTLSDPANNSSIAIHYRRRQTCNPHFCVRVQEQSLPARLDGNSLSPKKVPFNMETWSQGGLRYFVVGDASAADIDSLAKLFKAAS